MIAEYVTLGIYFIILIELGAVRSRQDKNLRDSIRGGAQGVWWLVGPSVRMSPLFDQDRF